MNRKKPDLNRICFCMGVLLVLSAVVWLVFRHVSVQKNAEQIQGYVDLIYARIPEPRASVPEPRTNNTMPSLNVRKADFIAVMEVPSAAAVFPVGAAWNTDHKYPCRYDGSVYDGTLIIGATNHTGQFDFVKALCVGDPIHITDMTGNRFSYEISDIRYSRHADHDTLYSTDHHVTVFIKNIYGLEYIILHCTAFGA